MSENTPLAKNDYLLIPIAGVSYEITSHFSIRNAQSYLKSLKSTNDPKRALATVIFERLNQDGVVSVTVDEIIEEDEEVFCDYIMAIVNESEELKNIFNETEANDNLTGRFAIAYTK